MIGENTLFKYCLYVQIAQCIGEEEREVLSLTM